jgi:hypothetical protein
VKRHFLLTALLLAVPEIVSATSVQLHLTTSNPLASTGTWTVTAGLSDIQSLGIASFSIDVQGSSGPTDSVQAIRATTASQTLQVSNPPYSIFRSTGTIAFPDLTGINASQDTITAANTNDPTILRFGDGLLTDAVSPVYGTIAHGGTLTLATGRWFALPTATAPGHIQAVLTPGTFFNLFPLNYAVDDGTGQSNPPPAGAVQNVVAAASVVSSNVVSVDFLVPEPGSIVLMALGSMGLIAVADKQASTFLFRRTSQ